MKCSALFFMVMIVTGSIQAAAVSEAPVLSSSSGNLGVVQEKSDNPLFQNPEQRGLSDKELGTLVFLGLGLMLVPVIRRSILAKLLV